MVPKIINPIKEYQACGVYYDINAGAVQQEGKIRDTFVALMRDAHSVRD